VWGEPEHSHPEVNLAEPLEEPQTETAVVEAQVFLLNKKRGGPGAGRSLNSYDNTNLYWF
jgi:hypothetical protein